MIDQEIKGQTKRRPNIKDLVIQHTITMSVSINYTKQHLFPDIVTPECLIV
jgi:hypothetical protein